MLKNSPFHIFDMESDGLLDEVTKIHCGSYETYYKGEVVAKGVLLSKQDYIDFFSREGYFVGHNIIRYDLPVFFKILGIQPPKKVVDTLGLSFYLYPERPRHGLEYWGEDLGIEKPEVEDWKGQDLSVYIHRCQEDVKINMEIFRGFFTYLFELYNTEREVLNLIQYVNFKLECLRDQEEHKIKLDIEHCKIALEEVSELFLEKREVLKSVMPKDLGVIIKKRPSKIYKKNGELSKYGNSWFNYLREHNLPLDLEVVRDEPNPGSTNQLTGWLFELGWDPETFKIGSTGNRNPQVSLPFGQGLCPSVKRLYRVEPKLKALEEYYVLRHRISLFKAFLEEVDENGYIYSSAHGFTNTMRLTHSRPIANLPKPSKLFGAEVRACLTVENESRLMCGSDVSSLEDSTKQHYMYYYDPEYVLEMRTPGFDPHLDIGVLAELLTKEDYEFYVKYKGVQNLDPEKQTRFDSIDSIRDTSKTVNFSAVYGAGGPKIAESGGFTIDEGYLFHGIYWQRNKAVKQVARDCEVKTVFGQTWLFNPVSKFWMYLKEDKDRFSTLNQSTGVFVFDCWVREASRELRKHNIFILLQYHDEILLTFPKEQKELVGRILTQSMERVNDMLKLNVDITVSLDFGLNYSQCH